VASTFQLKDSKGNAFFAVMVAGPSYRLADGRALDYVDAEDTFRIAETEEVLMRPYPGEDSQCLRVRVTADRSGPRIDSQDLGGVASASTITRVRASNL